MKTTELKTEIRKITPQIYRACYTIAGDGETTVPFDTEAEADAFIRGVEHAIQSIDGMKWKEKARAAAGLKNYRKTFCER